MDRMHTINTYSKPYTYPQFMTNSSDMKTCKLIKDGNKSFEALVVHKSVALTVLVISYNYQGHAGTNKIYALIREDLSWEEI